MKRLLAAVAIAGMFGLGVPAYAQTDEVKQDSKKAGEAAKDAGKDVGDAGKAVGEAGKDVGKTVAKDSKKTAKSVKHAVTGKTYKATCKDGTDYSGTSRSKACADHGGVSHWNK
jgi:hypothetical protein